MALDINVLTLNVTRIIDLLLENLWLKIPNSFLGHIGRLWAKRCWGIMETQASLLLIFDLTSHTSWPLIFFNGNIKEASLGIWSSSILTCVGLLKLGWILLKGVTSLAHISDARPKSNRRSIPICHPEIGGDWRQRWFEASHPVTRAWKSIIWLPALVPQTCHAEVLEMSITCLELPCRSTLIPGGHIESIQTHSR